MKFALNDCSRLNDHRAAGWLIAVRRQQRKNLTVLLRQELTEQVEVHVNRIDDHLLHGLILDGLQ